MAIHPQHEHRLFKTLEAAWLTRSVDMEVVPRGLHGRLGQIEARMWFIRSFQTSVAAVGLMLFKRLVLLHTRFLRLGPGECLLRTMAMHGSVSCLVRCIDLQLKIPSHYTCLVHGVTHNDARPSHYYRGLTAVPQPTPTTP
jgi:hypothetical protein